MIVDAHAEHYKKKTLYDSELGYESHLSKRMGGLRKSTPLEMNRATVSDNLEREVCSSCDHNLLIIILSSNSVFFLSFSFYTWLDFCCPPTLLFLFFI